jgi:SAM-dependent methyltransferase
LFAQGSAFESLTTELAARSIDLDAWISQLRAIPYMSDPSLLATTDEHGRPAIGYRPDSGRRVATGSYATFEDVFRGSEAFVQGRQRVYLSRLVDHEPVLDIGCGRGEMLGLLAEAGVKALGVDVDPSMVDRAAEHGLDVQRMDGLAYLREQPDESIGAVFCAQVIEHLAFDDFMALHREVWRTLRPGGVFIAETINPHAVRAFKTFWTDPTHRVPIFPEVEVMTCQVVGFSEATVVFPNGSGDLDDDRWSQGEYAVIARK